MPPVAAMLKVDPAPQSRTNGGFIGGPATAASDGFLSYREERERDGSRKTYILML